MFLEVRKSVREPGFALVACVALMTLVVVVLLGMLSLARLESGTSIQNAHQSEARANARLALMMAIAELQKHTGPDQRVTARAAILEGDHPKKLLANRNWLGVWKTTHNHLDREWPLIGKASKELENTPYGIVGAYQDLRHTLPHLSDGRWKREQVLAWLVSKPATEVDPAIALDENSNRVALLVGRGSLGEKMSAEDFEQSRVLAHKVSIVGGHSEGAYAWHISDNNQKAFLAPHPEAWNAHVAHEAAPGANPEMVMRENGERPYRGFLKGLQPHHGKIVSYATAGLSQNDNPALCDALAHDYLHFTTYAAGLFTDTLMSGLRRDLTPLLMAHRDKEEIQMSIAGESGPSFFSSSYPIIPGPAHGVLGPSFAALRDWAQHKYRDSKSAETVFAQKAIRMRPTDHWTHGISDGACSDAGKWAECAPKIHPVMTECRWHYYFSHHNHRIRTHIIPRVCLWNPYNRVLKTPELSVIMPNPFFEVHHGMHFFPDEEHVEKDLKMHDIELFKSWVKRSGYVGGNVYKIRTNPFPPRRYLAFTLEATTMSPGQCHVFSPKLSSGLTSGGIRIQAYQLDDPSANLLSSKSIQGTDHFFYDHDPSVAYEIQAPDWKDITSELHNIDFGRIFDYQPALDLQIEGKVENFPFALKSGKSERLEHLYSSFRHPTLQLINNGAGGAMATKTFHCIGLYWGSANQKDASFGNLQTFEETPVKNAPQTHQVGAKLLWLNEYVGEGDPYNKSPHRHGTSSKVRWSEDHMVYNVCPVANWNVRAQLVSRSPVSQCANKWYMNSAGPWLLQFVPYRPLDVHDMPAASMNGFVKNPFGLAIDFSLFPNVVMFDMPSKDYGVISLASLRHAMLSPYSWSPSYLVGHSLRDMHAPAHCTAYLESTTQSAGDTLISSWDYLLGHAAGKSPNHGARCTMTDSQGLLQTGHYSAVRKVGQHEYSSAREVLAYDIAYETNHNLWDRYFFSSLPMNSAGDRVVWNPEQGQHLFNRRYQFNAESRLDKGELRKMLMADGGVNKAFWWSAQFLKNTAAFNVNSTSVEAWIAFLSGTYGIDRQLRAGESNGDWVSFARYRRPNDLADTDMASVNQAGGWMGGRLLKPDELRLLAHHIVAEVKKRGPFISIADFVNRALVSDQDEKSVMGAIDAAILGAGLNRNFEYHSRDLSTTVNVAPSSDAPDNNMQVFQQGYIYERNQTRNSAQPKSKAWGLPGFLTQGDILTPLAPFLAARGDAFTIRAYGESSAGGIIMARAWLEATVERTPCYVVHRANGQKSSPGNSPLDSALSVDHATGDYQTGHLHQTNQKLGRKYQLKTFRWLRKEEI
ncbi:MAG: hypothetical protein ACPIGG_00450 [Akkermansiaceae bacterium]